MLEFIVLGQVPGTHIQLTFFQVLTMSEVYLAVLLISHEVHASREVIRRLITPKMILKIVKKLSA